ncbi:ricin B lectin domain-containing protein [Microdochium bolleyi]|uniref:Ricin B lectin domain-containing protein n=1 Tax=Microdochium bolleyi TaxID=196109 RepID=A0A136IU45_9PEZI|nr:ricin B lectin domain-containing protein [Microdochium bolleyi]
MPELKDGSVVAFFNYGTGTCLDLNEGYRHNGADVIGFNYHGGANQHWRLVRAQSSDPKVWPVWNLVNVMTGTAMTMKSRWPDHNTVVTCWEREQGEDQDQMWHLITADAEASIYMLHNAASTLFVNLWYGTTDCYDRSSITGRKGGFNRENAFQLWRMRIISVPPRDGNDMELDSHSIGASSNKKRKMAPETSISSSTMSID